MVTEGQVTAHTADLKHHSVNTQHSSKQSATESVYLVTTEHTIETPIFKGALIRAINATTGAEIWTLSDYTGEFAAMSYAMADGYATFFNGYDNQVYSVGRGPSQTTVQAPLTQINAGETVVIQGTVTDIAAGTKQTTDSSEIPNGVPVSSDASMREWMGYVYQQQVEPTNFTGVPISIVASDPNGNYITIGSATTDANGVYHYIWTSPDVPGAYSIYAMFAGTNGYYPSNSETTVSVQSAHATVAPTTSTPTSAVDTYFYPQRHRHNSGNNHRLCIARSLNTSKTSINKYTENKTTFPFFIFF